MVKAPSVPEHHPFIEIEPCRDYLRNHRPPIAGVDEFNAANRLTQPGDPDVGAANRALAIVNEVSFIVG
jgi:hypothetical protein